MLNLFKNNDLSCQRGVSIAELAVVIAVIGLLAAIVSGGVRLKKAAELRSVITDVEGFRVAVEGFDDKYRDYPGDIDDAHSYWDDGADGVCGTASQCNGNADGDIRWAGGSTVDDEYYRAWQHLNLSGFLDGGYTGVAGGSDDFSLPGINVPATKRGKGGYNLMTWLAADSETSTNVPAGLYFIVGSVDDGGSTWLNDPLFTPAEAFSIDKKMDDGEPDAGKVNSRYGNVSSAWQTSQCLSGAFPNRSYDKTRTDIECLLYFSMN